VRAVSSRPRAMAHRVDVADGAAVETPILPTYLGAAELQERPIPTDVREFRQLRYGTAYSD
jgi:hypothetical protein